MLMKLIVRLLAPVVRACLIDEMKPGGLLAENRPRSRNGE
jgi:hypothetical protein